MRPRNVVAFGFSFALGCGGSTTPDLFGSGDASVQTPGVDAGDGGATTAEGGGPFDAASFCSSLEAWSRRCGVPFTAADCANDRACFSAIVRAEALGTFENCLVTRECATSRDTCAARAANPYLNDPTFEKYQQSCNARLQQCQQAGQPFPDDACKGPNAMLRPALLTDLASCFGQACNAIGACIDTKQAAAGCR